MEIGLVSCTKTKRTSPSVPAELYEPSPLFRKARAYVRENHDGWFVLSAKHHLLDPDGESIEPYDETLSTASVEEKREWSQTVYTQLRERELLGPDTTLVFHTGEAYYGELLPLLSNDPVQVEISTEGLMLGETLAWYNDRI